MTRSNARELAAHLIYELDYTAVRSPKGAKAHIVKKGPKRKQTYRSSTVHQVKKHKERDEVIFLRKMKQSNASIKTKKTKLDVARQAAAVSAARRIMVRISLWNIGSPMPPKKMVSTLLGMVARTCL